MSFHHAAASTLKIVLLFMALSLMAGCPKPVNEINNFATASESVFDTSAKALNGFTNLSSRYNIYMTALNNSTVDKNSFNNPYTVLSQIYKENAQQKSADLTSGIKTRLQAFKVMKEYSAALKELVNVDMKDDFIKSAKRINNSVNKLQNEATGEQNLSISAALGALAYGAGKIITNKIKYEALRIVVTAAESPVQELSKETRKDQKEFSKLAALMLKKICFNQVEYYNIHKEALTLGERVNLLNELKPRCQNTDKIKVLAKQVDKSAVLFATAHTEILKVLNSGGTDFSTIKAVVEDLSATGQDIKKIYDELLENK